MEQTIDTPIKTDESQNHFAEWKTSDKRLYTVLVHLYKLLGNANCWIYISIRKCKTIVATVSWGYKYVKTYQIVYFQYVQLILSQLDHNKPVFKKYKEQSGV